MYNLLAEWGKLNPMFQCGNLFNLRGFGLKEWQHAI